MAWTSGTDALNASVLVLNRIYMVVHVVGVRRAFGLLCRDLAEVVHLEEGTYANYDFDSWLEISELKAEWKLPEEDWLRSVNFDVQVPRVIRLLFYDRLPRRSLRLNRQTVFARDGHHCQYCGQRFPNQELSLDHVIPRSRGGQTTWENLVCACLDCNIRKGGQTPKEARMRLIRHPERPKQSPLLMQKLLNPKYQSWKTWLEGATYCDATGSH